MEDKMFQTTNQKMDSTFRTTLHHLPEETTHRDATARAPQRLTQRWTRLLGLTKVGSDFEPQIGICWVIYDGHIADSSLTKN